MSGEDRAWVALAALVCGAVVGVAWAIAFYNVHVVEYRGTHEAVLRGCIAACVGDARGAP